MNEDPSGDDLKVVSWSIIFTKPGFEAILQARRDEVVDYATSGASFGALKMAEFFGRVQRHGIPWPSGWEGKPSDEYPEPGHPIRQIPEGDRKYVDFVYEVIARQSRRET
jgi:hypothetical protein